MPLGANKAAIMGVAGVSTADVVLIQSQTATGDSELDFSSGIDSTYGEYIFRFYNINGTANAHLVFQVNATDDPGGDYDQSEITSATFRASNSEAASSSLAYINSDQANGTAFQPLLLAMGSGADESGVGEMHLFNPSSTTYVKHFYSRNTAYNETPSAYSSFVAGYINDTTAIDDIRFKMTSGDFDGTIKMWGVK